MAISAQVYSGTKHAVEAMGAALRLELAPFEISVSSINPGYVRTKILNFQHAKDPQKVASCKSRYLTLTNTDLTIRTSCFANNLQLYEQVLGEKAIAKEADMIAKADTPQAPCLVCCEFSYPSYQLAWSPKRTILLSYCPRR